MVQKRRRRGRRNVNYKKGRAEERGMGRGEEEGEEGRG